ncbi:SpaH/EbpB family LPXTG-anchored major pilin [Streptococcus parasuis]|uniref:SpaH/EbpB family LPXTG-anchored major pilin n=1 Tax=Streptococcus parasuis TaxID=1501662 RepID=UPI001C2C6B5A|nr:SpaH/EbpB family LPXTG-anchored major pilin [Streptococcus parasuis]MBV1943440.1 SpaH/EbpB family LPXTG-anchored major pilin [Streptococcus parasuis]QXF05158.1 SpaH/EbpB family LPXTG-anchored major pilin [Streptococcus parasuis]
MKKIKVFALLATLFVGIFSNLFTPVVSAADDEKVSITLHKVKDYAGVEITNTGEILSEDFYFLPGITFKVYDVTKEYYDAYNAFVEANPDKPVSDAITAAVTEVKGKPGDAPSGKTAVATQTTAGDGSATFSLNAKSGMTTGTKPVPRDAVYLFVEQPSGDVDKDAYKADNLVVSLPIYSKDTNGNDTVLENIHLYPKNITKEIPFDKEITSTKNGETQRDFSIGQTINYKLTATIPANIAETNLVNGESQNVYNFFKFVDTFDTDKLTFIEDPKLYSVTVAGETPFTLTQVTDYTVEVKENADKTTTVTTALTTAGISKLALYANKEISFNYQMKIKSLDYIDTGIVNTAKATFGHDGENGWNKETKPDSETVKTGGYKFVKVDGINNNKKLAGAEFVVRESKEAGAKYFKATADGGQWVDTYREATKYQTGTDGIVDVKGLEYGAYQLQETIAPEGYALPTGDAAYTPFEVKEGSYKNYNLPLEGIPNTPKGFLPTTGGAGIILFVALGAAMVGLAGVYFTSRRKDA